MKYKLLPNCVLGLGSILKDPNPKIGSEYTEVLITVLGWREGEE